MSEEKKPSPVASPCISVCYLDDDGLCEGCYRTVDEIAEWIQMSNDDKRAVLVKCNERRRASGMML